MRRILTLVLLIFCIFPALSASAEDAPQIDGLTFVKETPLQYATGFHIYQYEGGYSLISIDEYGSFLVVPENQAIPAKLDSEYTVLQKPLNTIYLAATSAMSLFDAVDAVDHIRLTGTQASGWYVDSAVKALEDSTMLFAGKYSEPDYEMLLLEDCCLAIESTMIFHTPKVKEMIEDLGIPVLVDRSSYEPHPLGRTEWIKLYAALVGKENDAEEFFNQQVAVLDQVSLEPSQAASIAFFYVNSDGSVVIRNPNDYIPQMIELGGGHYIAPILAEGETSASVSVTMESFYSAAWNADYLIYNASVDVPLESIEQLIAKDAMFAEFTAVKNGNVWSTGKSFYQATDIVGQMILDINRILNGRTDETMTFLSHVS